VAEILLLEEIVPDLLNSSDERMLFGLSNPIHVMGSEYDLMFHSTDQSTDYAANLKSEFLLIPYIPLTLPGQKHEAKLWAAEIFKEHPYLDCYAFPSTLPSVVQSGQAREYVFGHSLRFLKLSKVGEGIVVENVPSYQIIREAEMIRYLPTWKKLKSEIESHKAKIDSAYRT